LKIDEQDCMVLHAVVVHDGTADSGHYFVFIKDHSQE
jgi:uncharacterized UBP type Zn finger protein